MNLKQQLEERQSKANCEAIVLWVGSSQARFDELVRHMIGDHPRLAQTASWPASYCVSAHPNLIKKHIGDVIANLQKPGIHDAIKRNTMRLLQEVEIPEPYQGTIMDLCFKLITSPIEKPAIKAFSLTVLQQFAAEYPDILPEIKTIIETQYENESPAFRSRANKLLKAL